MNSFSLFFFFIVLFRFDPWSMLVAFKKKARTLGVQFIDSEVVAIQQKHNDEQMEGKLNSIEVLNKLQLIFIIIVIIILF